MPMYSGKSNTKLMVQNNYESRTLNSRMERQLSRMYWLLKTLVSNGCTFEQNNRNNNNQNQSDHSSCKANKQKPAINWTAK